MEHTGPFSKKWEELTFSDKAVPAAAGNPAGHQDRKTGVHQDGDTGGKFL